VSVEKAPIAKLANVTSSPKLPVTSSRAEMAP
jgi:hypothetical protein